MTGTAALVLPRSAGVFDEMGYLNLRPEQTNIFFKLMEERYRQRPTMHCERRSLLAVAQLLVALEEQMRDILMHPCGASEPASSSISSRTATSPQ